MSFQQRDGFIYDGQESQNFMIVEDYEGKYYRPNLSHIQIDEIPKILHPSPDKSRSPPEKNKTIKKKQKKEPKKCIDKDGKREKRLVDTSITARKGRPTNDPQIQKDHLAENKSYNDIVFHFARFLIFLKKLQGSEKLNYALQLSNQQSQWMSTVEDIMSKDNYPEFDEKKPTFLLHPNSPHFVFRHLKQTSERTSYTSNQVKFLIFAFLKRRAMLTETIFHYIANYWNDIINLVNNPNMVNEEPRDEHIEGRQEQMESAQINQQQEQNEPINRTERTKKPSENEELEQELRLDESIAAYQIACYLHACIEKHKLEISE